VNPTALKATLILLACLLVASGASRAQDSHVPDRYNLTGDDVSINVDENGARHLVAEGNVLLVYTIGEETWTLSAETIEFVEELDDDGHPVSQVAYAESMINLTGPDVTITAPGRMEVDVLQRSVHSNSEDIHMVFPDGELTTDSLEIIEETRTDDYGNEMLAAVINTAVRTEATYHLAGTEIFSTSIDEETDENIFGSLRFDFRSISIDTERTVLVFIDNKPYKLDCPDPAVVTTTRNRLVMPSCTISFDPRSLVANYGIDLYVGDETVVSAGALILSYPNETAMEIKFMGCSPEDGNPAVTDEKVTISNPAGTFTASMITVTVQEDGSHRVEAVGGACFELPINHYIESTEPDESVPE